MYPCKLQLFFKAMLLKRRVMPYYENTREQEIIEEMIEDFNKDCIKKIHSVSELDALIK